MAEQITKKPRASKKNTHTQTKGFLLKEFVGYDVEEALKKRFGYVEKDRKKKPAKNSK